MITGAGDGLAAQAPQHLEPVDPGQHHVEQDEVGRAAERGRHRRRPVLAPTTVISAARRYESTTSATVSSSSTRRMRVMASP
jgi:hypothetical protein